MEAVNKKPRILFVQATEPGAYPPLVNAAHLMVKAGWEVTLLASPVLGSKVKMPSKKGIRVVSMPARRSYVMSKLNYLHYCSRVIRLALQLKPKVIYISDPIGAFPGLIAAKVSCAELVYHEHDSPNNGANLNRLFRSARSATLDRASLIVFPNADRARLVQKQSDFDEKKLRVVWNVPRLSELPTLPEKFDLPFVLYYHGSINPERLPTAVLEAVASFNGAVRLDVAGYEAPGAQGYVAALLTNWNRAGHEVMRYHGEQPHHSDLLRIATQCHAGLVLMPMVSDDINMKHMVGASNKAFDYMAAGLPLIVSDIPEWCQTFVASGYAVACEPGSVSSITSALSWLVKNPVAAQEISKRNRLKIENEWNYETVFDQVLGCIDKQYV